MLFLFAQPLAAQRLDEAITVDETEALAGQMRLAADKELKAWIDYLGCVSKGISAFATGKEDAATVVRGARGICGGDYEIFVGALYEHRKLLGYQTYATAETEAMKRLASTYDLQLGEVMLERFERQIAPRPATPRR